MVLTYVKTVWVNLKAPYITCNRLNKIENHINAMIGDISSALDGIDVEVV